METKTIKLSQSGLVPLTLILTGILALQAPMQARPPQGGPPEGRQAKMQERFQEISDRLGLTDEQKEKLQQGREAGRNEMKAIREDDSLSREEKREKMEALRQSRKETFESVLTDEQKSALKEMKANRKQKGQSGGKPGKAGKQGKPGKAKHLKKMMDELNLTPDQKAVLEAQKAATQQEIKAIRDNDSLSAEEKREKIQEIRQSRKGSLAGILTEEQKSKLESMRPQRKKDK